jgi:hypothetical protein
MQNLRSPLVLYAIISLGASLAVAVEPATTIDTSAFDPVIIGWPALTDAGIDRLIADQKAAIKEAQEAIAQIDKGTELNPRSGNADEVIARYQEDIEIHKQLINKYAQQRLENARSIAAKGNVEDLPQLRSVVGIALGVAKQDGLLGNDEVALGLWKSVVTLQTEFAKAFLATCKNQTFDQNIAIGIESQDQRLGTGIDVTRCAYRYGEAKVGTEPAFSITWRICGGIVGKLKIKLTGIAVGEGSGVIGMDGEGEYTAHYTTQVGYKADITDNGTVKIVCQKACGCLEHPELPECADVNTPKPELSLIAQEGKSLTGSVNMPSLKVNQPVVWKDLSVADPRLHHSLLWEGYLFKWNKVDKPCDPDNIEIP